MANVCLVAVFDLVNVRDLDVLGQLSERHRSIKLALLDDDQVTRLYGRAPVMSFTERSMIAAQLRGVDEVIRFDPDHRLPADECYVIAGEPVPDGQYLRPIVPRRHSASDVVNAAIAPRTGALTPTGQAVA